MRLGRLAIAVAVVAVDARDVVCCLAMLLFGERGGPEQKQSQNAVTTPKFPLSRRRVVAVGYWSGVAEL
jgi:hypothetical protein